MRTWPLPAVLVWGLAWVVFRLLASWELGITLAAGLAASLGIVLSVLGNTWWRRTWIGLGFPLSLMLSTSVLGLPSVPAWSWLVPLAVLLLIYPVNAWRDAPLFPTPAQALDDLPNHAPLPASALILDAGCGTGAGLLALRSAYPHAHLHGLEYAWPLRLLCALRCPWARIRQGNIWTADWSGYAMVYLFQRPESMGRAVAKAAELSAGAWMVSLEFEATELMATSSYRARGGKMVWLYEAPFHRR
jgi:hypothetical protein